MMFILLLLLSRILHIWVPLFLLLQTSACYIFYLSFYNLKKHWWKVLLDVHIEKYWPHIL